MSDSQNIRSNSDSVNLADHALDRHDAVPTPAPDWRHLSCGRRIPAQRYSDQPYIVKTDDGAWLCVLTTGVGREGQSGQHVVSARSTDQGRTWSDLVDVEPADGPEASYAVLLKVPSGRIYCFYDHNSDNIRQVKADNPPYPDGYCKRVDSLGYFVFKYSDDHGKTWSNTRYPIPVREMEIDRQNVYGGKIRFFWNVGKPFVHAGAAYVSLHKVGGFGHGFFTRSEGVLLCSPNILTEDDPEKIVWETLPDGDKGLRTPPGGGPIAEEHSYSVLSDGTFFCVYRSIDGHPVCAYSRDCGHTWSEPQYMRYADGRLMKHPRAANFAWRCSNGKFLYWFHNHGGNWYEDRNPTWLCCGVEDDTPDGKAIKWSQPEIVLYDDDTFVRMSYPDLVEDGGATFLTETQKNIARVHEIDPVFLQGLFNQFENHDVCTRGLLLSLPVQGDEMPTEVTMPTLPEFIVRDAKAADYGTKDLRQGFSLDMWVRLEELDVDLTLFDTRLGDGQGLCLRTTRTGALEIILNDGRTENRWSCEPGMLQKNQLNHVCVVVDGGPKIIIFVVNGMLCDGGTFRQFGWGRFSPNLRHANGANTATIDPAVKALRIYGVALRVSEVVGNYRSGAAQTEVD
jgi:hypothetical protein